MAKSKPGFEYGKYLLTMLMITVLVSSIFAGAYLVRKPKEVRESEATSNQRYVVSCGTNFSWDPVRTFTLNMDDNYSGVLTDQYLSFGPLFDYNMVQGVGLNKVAVNNPLNPGNGYAVTISSDERPFVSPISSPTETSMILKFPSPVETIQFQMMYDEPFDLSDTSRPHPMWGVDFKIYVRNNDGTDSWAFNQAWDLTMGSNVLTMISGASRTVCYTVGWNKLISRVDILVPADKHARVDSYPPDKISFDNFKIQIPNRWQPPTGSTEPEPTPSVVSNDPGTCQCLPNGRLKTDDCNHANDYEPICNPAGCQCVH